MQSALVAADSALMSTGPFGFPLWRKIVVVVIAFGIQYSVAVHLSDTHFVVVAAETAV